MDFPALQKLHSRDALLSADEFQKLFDTFNKRVTKEVNGAGLESPAQCQGHLGLAGKSSVSVGSDPLGQFS